MSKIKTIIVDDSAVVREVFTSLLKKDPAFEVIATAQDPIFAIKKMEANWPDLVVLDLEMPRMSGMDFLKQIMKERPTPVVICSTLVQAGAKKTFEALASGAMSVIAKPTVGLKNYLEDSNQIILQTLKEAARVKVRASAFEEINIKPVRLSDGSKEPIKSKKNIRINHKFDIIALGASTGGTQAIEKLLSTLPTNLPGMVIVQHMPEKFTLAFANRLNDMFRLDVKEAVDGDEVKPGRILIAPGNFHMTVVKKGNVYICRVKEGPPVGYHRPAVDVLFRSVAKVATKKAVGVILTGMGRDGSKGMLEMKNQGAYNIAQNQESSVVYSMPREAIAQNAIDIELPLIEIGKTLIELCGS